MYFYRTAANKRCSMVLQRCTTTAAVRVFA